MKPGDIVRYVGPAVVPERPGVPAVDKKTPAVPSAPAYRLFGAEALVVAVNDPKVSPGKHVALCFKDAHYGLHTCDGITPEGHGRWEIPDRFVTPEEFDMISKRAEQATAAKATAAKLIAGYVTP